MIYEKFFKCHFLLVTLFFLSQFACSNKKNEETIEKPVPKSINQTINPGFSPLIPEGANWILVSDFSKTPDPFLKLIPNKYIKYLKTDKSFPEWTIISSFKNHNLLVHSGFNKNITLKTDLNWRKIPIAKIKPKKILSSSQNILMATIKPKETLTGPDYLVKMAIDLSLGKGLKSNSLTTGHFHNILVSLQGEKIDPSFLFLFHRENSHTLFKEFKNRPLKGGVKIIFPPNWIVISGVLFFPSINRAESFITLLKQKVLAIAQMKFASQLGIINLLDKVSVHPEGQKVYIQWFMKRKEALPILKRIIPLSERIL